ncbi:MAG TPA: hypothetical protein VID03_06250 [Acidimicrobiia bacterium]|jgi:hypothetical protein
MWARWLVAVAGVGLVIVTLLSAIRTVVLPRADASLITQLIFRTSAGVFRSLASERRSFGQRDRVMALYAPVTLMLLPIAWLSLVGLGYTTLFWATGFGDFGESGWASASSLLTLGSVPLESGVHHVLATTEAALGLGLLALLISFLPAIYSAFARREQAVNLLEVRAGSPPTAVELLTRFHIIGWTRDLSSTWERWEAWFAHIEESHLTYPALTWFRSPQPDRSWVTAAGTVLDSAGIWLAAIEHPRDPQAPLCIRAGYLALRRVAAFFGIQFDPDPAPTDPISIGRAEFDDALDHLAEAGLPVVVDREQAWRDFAGWRVNYDTVLLELAELTMAPYAPWVSDRSSLGHHRPRITRWGLKS